MRNCVAVPRLVFDTDPGVDDTLALLYLHRHPDVTLDGITTVAGNGTIDAVTRNALYLTERFGIDAPVAQGAAVPLSGVLRIPPAHIHGDDALGGLGADARPERALDPRPAHQLIIDAVRAHPGEVTIVAVAMLTNLALAIRADPGIVPLVRGVVAMGGAFGTGRNYGNASPVAEANIFGDPEAADLVCTTPWPLTLLGLDVTERTIMTEDYLARIRDGGTSEGRFIWDVTRSYQNFHETRDRVKGMYAHDPSAATCAVDDGPFVFRNGPVRVVTDGIARGLTLQKAPGRQFGPNAWDDAPNQRVALGVDTERVLDLFAKPFVP